MTHLLGIRCPCRSGLQTNFINPVFLVLPEQNAWPENCAIAAGVVRTNGNPDDETAGRIIRAGIRY